MNASRMREEFALFFRGTRSFKGKTRAIRILNWGFNRLGASPKALCRMKVGGQLYLDMRSRTEFIPYYLGGYDSDVIAHIVGHFGKDWVVLDVGANIGFFSIPFALRLKSLGGRLYAFEPVPSNFLRLKENAEANALGQVIRLEPIALSSQASTLKMTLREDFQGGGETGNAAVKIDDGKDDHFQMIDVPAMRLDDYVAKEGLQRLDFIKVDVEGHEGAFLEGARESVSRFRPVILAELNEGYFARKGVDINLLATKLLGGLKYVYLKQTSRGNWELTQTLSGRGVAEDVLLVPIEKASLWARDTR